MDAREQLGVFADGGEELQLAAVAGGELPHGDARLVGRRGQRHFTPNSAATAS